MSAIGFLREPEVTAKARDLFEADIAEVGYVMNVSRLWAHQPTLFDRLVDMLREIASTHKLSPRLRGILVAASASAMGDSYCALSWGTKLAKAADAEVAASVLRGDDEALTAGERAAARWARQVVRSPNRTVEADVQALRDSGFTDSQIFAITVFVAERIAFSSVNDALGVRPDAAFLQDAPAAVLDAVTYGRPIEHETAEEGSG